MTSPPSQEPPSPPQPSRAAFGFIFFTVALDMLSLGIVIPILPTLIKEMEGGDFAAAARATGVFGFLWAFMQLIASPVAGALSDRFGRRPVILASNFGLGLDYLVMALAPSLPWLALGRVISGITSASYPTASAYIVDVTPPEKRAARFGMLGAAFGLGFVIGPWVGGELGDIDLRLPFWIAGGLSLLNALYGFLILPESLPPEKRSESFTFARANPLGSIALLRSHPVLFALAVSFVVSALAHEVLPNTFVLYCNFRYDWSAHDVGRSLAVVGVSSTIVQAVLTSIAIKRFGDRACLVVGLGLGAVGMLAFGLAPTGTWFLVSIVPFALWGLQGPALMQIASRHVGADEQGQLQGAFSAIRGLTGMLGPILFTQVLALAIGDAAVIPWPGIAFGLSGALLFASMIAAAFATRSSLLASPPSPSPTAVVVVTNVEGGRS